MCKLLKIKFILIFISFLLPALANASSAYQLNKDARHLIDATDVYLAIPQRGIEINNPNSIQVADGLFVALIIGFSEHNRSKNLNAAQNSMRGKLSGYDYGNILAKEINSKLKSISWLNASNITIERTVDDNWSEKKVKTSLFSSAVLLIAARYFLSSDLDVVNTIVSLKMFPNKISLEKYKEKHDTDKNSINDGDVIYRNNFIASTNLFASNDQENTLILGKSDKNALIDALESNARKIATYIYNDINSSTDKSH